MLYKNTIYSVAAPYCIDSFTLQKKRKPLAPMAAASFFEAREKDIAYSGKQLLKKSIVLLIFGL